MCVGAVPVVGGKTPVRLYALITSWSTLLPDGIYFLFARVLCTGTTLLACGAGVSRAGARTGLQLLGHGDMQRFNSSSLAWRVCMCVCACACLVWLGVCGECMRQQVTHTLHATRAVANSSYHSVHFITHQSFAFY